MLKLLVAALLAVPSTTALAFDCPFGSQDALAPVRWSASAQGADIQVRLGVSNPSDKLVRMVDAAVWFVDPLGRIVADAGLQIDPDFMIEANGANITVIPAPDLFARMVGARNEDFSPTICTKAILFADGTKAEF